MLRITATKAADSAAPSPAALKDADLVVIELKTMAALAYQTLPSGGGLAHRASSLAFRFG